MNIIIAAALVAALALVLFVIRRAGRPATPANDWNAYVADVTARDAATRAAMPARTVEWMQEADFRFSLAMIDLGAGQREIETASFNRAFGLS